ncbi:coiled-coil domain-containing protein 24 [Amia ocellicauda]|uniref:coiled-coil domain-containing protein 24 n=1 Tax=Amia ocellicauda TaxID=2972642 RepID=UPI0034638D5C
MAALPDDGDCTFMESYEPLQSLWKLVEEHVPESELPVVRSVLGDAMVDLSLEMHSEVEMWLQIWQDLKSNHERVSKASASRTVLADPPAIKEMLKQEIHLLLLNVREKASKQGRDENKALSLYSPGIVSYVMGSSNPGPQLDRAGGARSPQGDGDVRPASRTSTGSSFEDEIEAIKDRLNVTQIDEVVAHLKSVLKEECDALGKDVEFLQKCVAHEHQHSANQTVREPSVAELKEERKRIERDLQITLSTHNPLLSDKRSLMKGSRAVEPIGVLAADVSKSRTLSAPSSHQRDLVQSAKNPHQPFARVKSLPLSKGAHNTRPSTVAGSCTSPHEPPHHRPSSWNPANPRSNSDVRRPMDLPESHVPCPEPNHFIDSVSKVCSRQSKSAHIKAGTGLEMDTVDTRCRRHFHVLSIQTLASDSGSETTHTSRTQTSQNLTQTSPSRFLVTQDCDPASKRSIEAFVPTPPSAVKPAGRPPSTSRRMRLLQGNCL